MVGYPGKERAKILSDVDLDLIFENFKDGGDHIPLQVARCVGCVWLHCALGGVLSPGVRMWPRGDDGSQRCGNSVATVRLFFSSDRASGVVVCCEIGWP